MFRQLLRNGQVTLPKEALTSFNLRAGDPLDIQFDAKEIRIRPLPIEEFTDEEYEQLADKLDSLRHTMKGKVFTNRADLNKYLDGLMKSR